MRMRMCNNQHNFSIARRRTDEIAECDYDYYYKYIIETEMTFLLHFSASFSFAFATQITDYYVWHLHKKTYTHTQ